MNADELKAFVEGMSIAGTPIPMSQEIKCTEKVLYASDADISGSIILNDYFSDFDFVIFYTGSNYGISYDLASNVRCPQVTKDGYLQLEMPSSTRFTIITYNADDSSCLNVTNYNGGVGLRKIVGIKYSNFKAVELYSDADYILSKTIDIDLLDDVENYDYLYITHGYYENTQQEVATLLDVKLERGKRKKVVGYGSRSSYVYLYNDVNKIRHIYSNYRLNKIVGIKIG
jgi:hypothetical protein